MLNITITQNMREADAITHSSTFHADEVFATVILMHAMNKPVFKLCRTLTIPNDLPNDLIVYDIGFGVYDHHQKDKELRYDGLPYAACGLIWRDFGRDALENVGCPFESVEKVWESVEKKLVRGIDGSDNGVNIPKGDYCPLSVSCMISQLNPLWDAETESENGQFLKAVQLADQIFKRVVESAIGTERAVNKVEEAIWNATGHIMILPTYAPWVTTLLKSLNPVAETIWYCIFPSKRGGYAIQAVPIQEGSFIARQPVPKEWWGASKEDLPRITGVMDCTFVHNSGFLGSCDSLEGAVQYAKNAVDRVLLERK